MKILVISDVHVGNYPNYETYKYERLEFYLTYAERIVELAKEEGIDTLFIAGDFMDVPVNSPEVLRIAKEVLKIWSRYFKDIYYVLGQHDLRSKNYDDPEVHKYSITNVIAPDNMHYSDHKILHIGGRSIALMNFTSEHDLSWIPEKVDLFISHWTINTNGFGEENSQKDKFTLGIAGDIHYPCSDDNLHSVGMSVPRYLGDCQSGTSVVVDLDTLEWYRVENDPDNKLFTRYIKTTDWEDEGPSEEKLLNGVSPKIYKIYRPAEESLITSRSLKEFSDDRVSDINEIILRSVKENNLEKVHEEILSRNPIKESVDLNFKLISLAINNIRSIDEYVWDFSNKSGVYQIIGENGSGKSSLMWSLNYALRGGLDIRDQIREGESQASVYLKLEYQGKVYGIYRGTDGVWLDIDGVYQSFGGKRDTENAIYEQLPFIYYLDSFFFDDEAVSIMGSYSSDRRIELLSTYYRIDVIQNYYDTSSEVIEELKQSSKEKWNDYYEEEYRYNSMKESLESKREELSDLSRESLEEDLENLTKLYKDRVSLESKNQGMTESEYEELKNSQEQRLKNYESRISKNSEALKRIAKTLENEGVHHEESDIDDLCNKHNKDYELLLETKADIKSIKSRLENFSEITCPNCGEIIGLIDLQQVSKQELEIKLESLRKDFHEKKEFYENEEDLIESMKSEEESYKAYQSAKKEKATVSELIEYLEEQIKSCKVELSNIESKYQESLELLKGKSSKLLEKEMNSIRNSLFLLDELNKLEENLESYELSGKLQSLKDLAESVDKELEEYRLYQQLFSNNGNLYKLILNSILDRFSSDSFKYEAVTEWYRGKEYTDITGYYKNYKMKEFRPYWKLSRGQKTLVDLDFIRNLITNSGVVVFDEILKFLSPANQIEGIRIINNMTPALKIITNQSENSLYVNNCLNLHYNGVTTEFSEG